MQILLNNQPLEVDEHVTLKSIVFTQVGEKQKGIAVAVNNTVVAKGLHGHYILQPNDSVLIIKATQGG